MDTSANNWPASCKEQVLDCKRPADSDNVVPEPSRSLCPPPVAARDVLCPVPVPSRTLGDTALNRVLYIESALPDDLRPIAPRRGKRRRQEEPQSPRCPSRAEASSSTTGVTGGGAASRTSARGPLNPDLLSRMALQSRLVLPRRFRREEEESANTCCDATAPAHL